MYCIQCDKCVKNGDGKFSFIYNSFSIHSIRVFKLKSFLLQKELNQPVKLLFFSFKWIEIRIMTRQKLKELNKNCMHSTIVSRKWREKCREFGTKLPKYYTKHFGPS